MTELNKRQRQVLYYIQSVQQTAGATPTLREIAAHFGFASSRASADHLVALKRKGFITSDPNKARSVRITTPLTRLRNPTVDIPLFGSIPAGPPQDREADAEGCVSVDVATLGFKPNRNAFALRVNGDSMIGKHIVSGDIVILEHGPEPRHGQIVAALIDGASTLKTFLIRGGKPYLKAENPKYPDLLPAQELLIQGVFKTLIRRVKE
jgi:repressor LexA